MPVINEVPLKLFQTAEETEKPERSEVIGTLPSWLQGSYLRVGPGKFDFGHDFSFNHWLDGYALLQKFEIKQGDIRFSKKYLESDAYKKGIAAKHPVINEFGTPAQRDPNKGFFSRIVSNLLPEFTDNNYAALFQIGSDTFASCDTCFFRKIDPESLDTQDKCDGNKLFGLNGQSAHPLVDADGDMYNVGFNLLPTAKYTFFKMPKAATSKEMMKKAKAIATFSSRWTGALSINHSFGMSENFLVYIEQPVTVSVGRIASSLVKGETLRDVLEWRPQEKNRFIVVNKRDGKIIKTEFISSRSFYFMHVVNCFEEDNQIILDIVSYESISMLDALLMERLRGNAQEEVDLSCIQRYVIPLIPDVKSVEEGKELLPSSSKCSAIRVGNRIILSGWEVTERGIEMPVFNKKFSGKKHRFIYAAATFNKSAFSHSITKTDMESGETLRWMAGEYAHPGEPYFVPKPGDYEEDEGVIVSAVTDERQGFQDFLVFLDAKTMKEIARANFKGHIPSGLHGLFLHQ